MCLVEEQFGLTVLKQVVVKLFESNKQRVLKYKKLACYMLMIKSCIDFPVVGELSQVVLQVVHRKNTEVVLIYI